MKVPRKYISRQAEITESFLREMNKHIDDFMAGTVEEMFSLKDITNIMFLHPVYVSNVIKLHTGFHPCHFYELRIASEAKKLLEDFSLSIGDVANRLTYDNSNFTKFFKEYVGVTPSEYRRRLVEHEPTLTQSIATNVNGRHKSNFVFEDSFILTSS